MYPIVFQGFDPSGPDVRPPGESRQTDDTTGFKGQLLQKLAAVQHPGDIEDLPADVRPCLHPRPAVVSL